MVAVSDKASLSFFNIKMLKTHYGILVLQLWPIIRRRLNCFSPFSFKFLISGDGASWQHVYLGTSRGAGRSPVSQLATISKRV